MFVEMGTVVVGVKLQGGRASTTIELTLAIREYRGVFIVTAGKVSRLSSFFVRLVASRSIQFEITLREGQVQAGWTGREGVSESTPSTQCCVRMLSLTPRAAA